MRPLLDEAFGNPSSRHWAGRPAKNALERASGQVASLLGAEPDEVVGSAGPPRQSARFHRDGVLSGRLRPIQHEAPCWKSPWRDLAQLPTAQAALAKGCSTCRIAISMTMAPNAKGR